MDRGVIRTEGLTKRYGRAVGLADLDLEVPAGVVFGYLGPNGAGKTTTIRLLLGLLRPTAGRAEVAGFDAWRQRTQAHARIGYLPGDFAAYADLTGMEYLTYLAHLRGGDHAGQTELLTKRLDLDPHRRIGELSSGNRQKVGLVAAFAHRPDVLVLDEPTSGLDPLVQREFLAIVREARDGGQTVFLSSHVLSEVEHIADMVGIVREGRLVVVERVDALKTRAVRRLELSFAGAPPAEAIRAVPGVRDLRVDGHQLHLAVEGSLAQVLRVAAPHGIENLTSHEASLEEIFLSYYTGDAGRSEG